MKKEEYRKWLDGRINSHAIKDRLSRIAKIESALKVDLDKEFATDGGKRVLDMLSYTRRDANNGKEAPEYIMFKEGVDVVKRLTDLRSAVKQYFKFLSEK